MVLPLMAQMDGFGREQLIKYTPQWNGERFADGRPKVSDALIERLRKVRLTSEEAAWGPLKMVHKYDHQWAGGFQILNRERGLTGRAFTCQFLPGRPEVAQVIEGEAAARKQNQHNVRMMDMLQPGDVLVVDMAGGRVADGVVVGDNLALGIFIKTGNGFVVNGGIRDQEGIEPHGFPLYYRGAHPSIFGDLMMTGINIPIQVGDVTVMPGDVVIGDREGLTFVPPHLAEAVVANAELFHLADEWRAHKFKTTGPSLRIGDYYGRTGMKDPELQRQCTEYVNRKLREEGLPPVTIEQWFSLRHSGTGCVPRQP
ncbi:MAG: hypothetical protein WD696_19205 [Bryobacteraceae bacterium]